MHITYIVYHLVNKYICKGKEMNNYFKRGAKCGIGHSNISNK